MFTFIVPTEEYILTNLTLDENIEIVTSYQDWFDQEMLVVRVK